MDGDPASDIARWGGRRGSQWGGPSGGNTEAASEPPDPAGLSAGPLSLLDVLMSDTDRLRAVHDAYIAAGADIITMATAPLTPTRLYDLGLESRLDDLLLTACGIACAARDAASREIRVAACLGPLVADTRRYEGPITELIGVYEYLLHMMATESDLIFCTGMTSVREAEAAALAGAMTGRPVWLCFAVDDSRPAALAGGEPLADAIAAVEGLPVDAILLQSADADRLAPELRRLAPLADTRFGGRAGVDGDGPAAFPVGPAAAPDAYGYWIEDWLDVGASIIGGGPATTPAHTAHARSLIDLRPNAPFRSLL